MQAKGTAVLTIPLFIKAKYGDAGYAQWLAALPESSRPFFTKEVLASTWYPLIEGLVEPTRTLCDVFYRGRIDGAVEQGRYSADHALKGVYKVFVRLGSPEFLIKKASTIMPTYYQPSAMEVVETGARTITARITTFETPHTIVEHRIKGWMERALEICGVKTPKAAIKCSMTTGAPHTDFVVTWS